MQGNVICQKDWAIFDYRMYMSDEEKKKYIGKTYPDMHNVRHKIEDVERISMPHYIYDGLALLIDGFWRFGCPESLIKGD